MTRSSLTANSTNSYLFALFASIGFVLQGCTPPQHPSPMPSIEETECTWRGKRCPKCDQKPVDGRSYCPNCTMYIEGRCEGHFEWGDECPKEYVNEHCGDVIKKGKLQDLCTRTVASASTKEDLCPEWVAMGCETKLEDHCDMDIPWGGFRNTRVKDECWKQCKGCDFSEKACRTASIAEGLQLGGQGHTFAGDYSETGCYTYESGKFAGIAFYGYSDRGMEVQTVSQLTTVSPPKRRIHGSYKCELDTSCRAVDGDLGKPCVFPFTFNGTTYNACTVASDPNGAHWCSTFTDADGIHVGGKGHWGHCSSGCPQGTAHDGSKCAYHCCASERWAEPQACLDGYTPVPDPQCKYAAHDWCYTYSNGIGCYRCVSPTPKPTSTPAPSLATTPKPTSTPSPPLLPAPKPTLTPAPPLLPTPKPALTPAPPPVPTGSPTGIPTESPTESVTESATVVPTVSTTGIPSELPSESATESPTVVPTVSTTDV